MNQLVGDRALVLGAGVAGLATARVLADFYAEVTVIDRDALPDGVEPRRGVPQDRHAHALLARGQQVLEDLFPGLTADLASAGAPVGDFLDDVRMFLSGHRLASVPTGLVAVSATRVLLESHVRARVAARCNVRFLARCDVVGLVCDGRHVTGVRLLRRADGSAEEELLGEVVIDATGRMSRAPAWLDEAGLDRPEEERMPIDVAYATRRYRLEPGALGGDLAVVCGPTPEHPAGRYWRSSRAAWRCSRWRVSWAPDLRAIPTDSLPSPALCPFPTSRAPSPTPSRSTTRSPTASPPTRGAATNGSDHFRTGSPSWATACAASTPSTDRG